ncbi:18016_t:CDS:2, partial [Rhizophagus irregularis]
NRCEKVVELELSLFEIREKHNNSLLKEIPYPHQALEALLQDAQAKLITQNQEFETKLQAV